MPTLPLALAPSNYYISLTNTKQEAMMKDFDYSRTNLQVNLETKVTKRLTVGVQASGRFEKTRDVGLPGGDGYFSSILSMFSSLPTHGPYANDNPEYMNNIPNRPDLNPALFRRDIAGYKDNMTKNFNGNLYAEYKFDFGLSAKFTYSYNYTHLDFDGFQYSYDLYNYDRVNDVYIAQGGQSARMETGRADRCRGTLWSIYAELYKELRRPQSDGCFCLREVGL